MPAGTYSISTQAFAAGTGSISSPEVEGALALAVTAPIEVPEPMQQSSISGITTTESSTASPLPVIVSGNFVEPVTNIDVNGVRVAIGRWVQTTSLVSFSASAMKAGSYSVQIFNGSHPILPALSFSVVDAPKPATIVTSMKNTYIHCSKAHRGTRTVYGVHPSCPLGYEKV